MAAAPKDAPSGTAARPSTYTAGAVAGGDWPAQAADTIERVVGVVRENTTGRAITVARGIVFGVFAAFIGTAIGVVVAIAAVRILVVYLPDAAFGEDHVWAAHLLVGLVFAIPGLIALRMARRPPKAIG